MAQLNARPHKSLGGLPESRCDLTLTAARFFLIETKQNTTGTSLVVSSCSTRSPKRREKSQRIQGQWFVSRIRLMTSVAAIISIRSLSAPA
jgi:hypothetical protein